MQDNEVRVVRIQQRRNITLEAVCQEQILLHKRIEQKGLYVSRGSL